MSDKRIPALIEHVKAARGGNLSYTEIADTINVNPGDVWRAAKHDRVSPKLLRQAVRHGLVPPKRRRIAFDDWGDEDHGTMQDWISHYAEASAGRTWLLYNMAVDYAKKRGLRMPPPPPDYWED